MTPVGTAFCLISSLLVIILPRRWAVLPLTASIFYMTMGQVIDIAGFNIFAYRLVLVAAIARVIIRGETSLKISNPLDKQVIILCLIAIITGFLAGELKSSAGFAFNVIGFYLAYRSLITSLDDAKLVFLNISLLIILLAVLMVFEKVDGHNRFAQLGGVPEITQVREEKNRAQGPFRHPILAGTAGAIMVAPFLSLYSQYPKISAIGMVSSFAIAASSASSGPYGTMVVGLLYMLIYRYRKYLRFILVAIVILICSLEIVMKDHVWYLLNRIDIVGGSTGWHRAELITQAGRHISEWWLVGTSYTRHWMATGVSWSPNHTDITNQYILMGVNGGLPLMLAFMSMLAISITSAHKIFLLNEDKKGDGIFYWSISAMLVSQIITFISVAYFDQIIGLLCLNIAIIGSLYESRLAAEQIAIEVS